LEETSLATLYLFPSEVYALGYPALTWDADLAETTSIALEVVIFLDEGVRSIDIVATSLLIMPLL
jgi:hypothetical protein